METMLILSLRNGKIYSNLGVHGESIIINQFPSNKNQLNIVKKRPHKDIDMQEKKLKTLDLIMPHNLILSPFISLSPAMYSTYCVYPSK